MTVGKWAQAVVAGLFSLLLLAHSTAANAVIWQTQTVNMTTGVMTMAVLSNTITPVQPTGTMSSSANTSTYTSQAVLAGNAVYFNISNPTSIYDINASGVIYVGSVVTVNPTLQVYTCPTAWNTITGTCASGMVQVGGNGLSTVPVNFGTVVQGGTVRVRVVSSAVGVVFSTSATITATSARTGTDRTAG